MADEAFCEHGWRKIYPEPCPACAASSNPGSKLEQVGAAGGGLSEEERAELLGALVSSQRPDMVLVVAERIVREREAAAWDACHEKLCVDERLQSCEWPGHVNPYRSADR